ncbi:MAG: hypothetical protein ABSA68_13890 [Xanthobacteraceae bacterium]
MSLLLAPLRHLVQRKRMSAFRGIATVPTGQSWPSPHLNALHPILNFLGSSFFKLLGEQLGFDLFGVAAGSNHLPVTLQIDADDVSHRISKLVDAPIADDGSREFALPIGVLLR